MSSSEMNPLKAIQKLKEKSQSITEQSVEKTGKKVVKRTYQKKAPGEKVVKPAIRATKDQEGIAKPKTRRPRQAKAQVEEGKAVVEVIKEKVRMPRKKGNNKKTVKVIPLGGLEQIGMNITAFEYGESIIVVDCGLAFPDEDMLGIDLVIPDVSYLVNNFSKVKGFVITHGHEDHIGAIPYILKKLNVPVYGTRLTLDAKVATRIRLFLCSEKIMSNVLPTVLSDIVNPAFIALVDSHIIIKQPSLPISAMRCKSAGSPNTGV